MSILEIIRQKRDGGELTTQQITWFIEAYTAGDIPDYQAAALLMAIYLRGMNRRETVDLTLAMVRSGEQLDLHDVIPFAVDKHSSGGVGDKTTLIVQPMVAACGVPVGKMSGRGLGSSGGTLDKMESIAGWSSELTSKQFKQQLEEVGLVLSGQTAELVPADGMLYALRDVTGTIESPSLIAASIMSKKLASGADAIVLDVKVGNGAFMPSLEDAQQLAELMVKIGKDAGRETVALIADMNQPLGHAVGNALEVAEAIDSLNGGGPEDLWAHCVEVAGHMLHLAGKAHSLEEARRMAAAARDDGKALAKFRAMVVAQGGDATQIDNPETLPRAKLVEPVYAQRSGFIAGIDAGAIGRSCVELGGGRHVKGEDINHAVGMVIPVKVGDHLAAGELLGTVHADDPAKLVAACEKLLAAISWSAAPVERLPHFYATVT